MTVRSATPNSLSVPSWLETLRVWAPQACGGFWEGGYACGAKTRRQVRHGDTELFLSFASHGITYRHVHEKGVAK